LGHSSGEEKLGNGEEMGVPDPASQLKRGGEEKASGDRAGEKGKGGNVAFVPGMNEGSSIRL